MYQQSTDFHFPDLDKQFCIIQQNLEKQQKRLQKSGGGCVGVCMYIYVVVDPVVVPGIPRRRGQHPC